MAKATQAGGLEGAPGTSGQLVMYCGRLRSAHEVAAIKERQRAAGRRTQEQRKQKRRENANEPVDDSYETSVELSFGEADRLRQGKYRKTVEWVIEHMDADACPRGAAGMAKSLWQVAHEDKAGFLKTYLPLLIRSEKPEEQEGPDEAVEANIALIDEWFREREDLCKHCGRGPGYDGPDFKEAVAFEREACARIAEQDSCLDLVGDSKRNALGTAKKIAAAIRARGKGQECPQSNSE
jgi:ferredoxin